MRRLIAPVLVGALIGTALLVTSSSAGTTCAGFPATDTGSQGDDTIVGSPGFDVIVARGGDDVVIGDSGGDVICAGEGHDFVFGEEGSDLVLGGGGDDFIEGNEGPDELEGGSGFDRVSYLAAGGSVGVSLAGGTGSGADGQDALSTVEGVYGSDHADVLAGDSGYNFLNAGEGDDELYGRGGIDIMFGGTGSDKLLGGEGTVDIAYFLDSPQAVEADLEEGVATSGSDEDLMVEVEAIIGSEFPDVLRGDDGENIMSGSHGDDLLDGRGGLDFLLSFGAIPEDPNDPDAVETLLGGPHMVDLSAGTASDQSDPTEVVGDTVISFASGAGGERDDVLIGTPGDDFLIGEGGDDELIGLGGEDALSGGLGADALRGGAGSGDQAAYLLEGKVEANLATGRARIQGSTDRIFDVEEIAGSEGKDVLRGDSGPNVLVGFGGKDRIFGAGGKDVLSGRPVKLPLGDLDGGPGYTPPPTNLKPARLVDGGPGRDSCEGAKTFRRCEKKRLTGAAKAEILKIIRIVQDIKRRRGVRLSG